MNHIVVVGAGHAGAACVARLREKGFAGRITLVGEEPVLPYQRPPLSKDFLLGKLSLERLLLRPKRFYEEHDVTVLSGVQVSAIDASSATLMLGDDRLSYDALVLTTGGVPRRLPAAVGGAMAGVHVLRTVQDVTAFAPRVQSGTRLLVVGGGYIGLEAAAVAAQCGLDVTLVEDAPRILKRVACAQTADYFRDLHRANGVTILEGVKVERLFGTDRVKGAQLSDGRTIPTDEVVVGIGISPRTDLAKSAGIAVQDGILVDEYGRTSHRNIWAAGDCTSFPHDGTIVRLESVPHAADHAQCVADNILGNGRPYNAKPWFWSDQFDTKLQIAGLNTAYDRIVERRSAASLSFWYYRCGALIAVDAINDPRVFMTARRLIEGGRSPDPALVADGSTDPKALLSPPLEAQSSTTTGAL